MTIKLGPEAVRTIGIFERITGVHALDCLIRDDYIYFLVEPEKIGLAIGRDARAVKQLRSVLGKPIKLLSYSKSPEGLLRGNIRGLRNIYFNNNRLTISVRKKEKKAVIGRNGENINVVREILRRHFQVEHFKLR